MIFGLHTNSNRLGFELPRSVGQFILDHEKDDIYKNTGFGSQFEYYDSRAGVAIQRLVDSEVPIVKNLDDLQMLTSISNRLVAGGFRPQFAEPPADISWKEESAIRRLRTLERDALRSLRQSDSEFDPIYEHWTDRLKDWRQTEGDITRIEPDSGEQMIFVAARAHFWEKVLPEIGTSETALSDIEHIHLNRYVLTFANGISLSCALETSEQSVPEIYNTNRFVATFQDRSEPVSVITRDTFIGHEHRAIGIGLRHIPEKIGCQIVIYFGGGDRGLLEMKWRFLWCDW